MAHAMRAILLAKATAVGLRANSDSSHGETLEADFRPLASDPPISRPAVMIRIRQVLDEATAFLARMPTEQAGLLFLLAGQVVQPDPDRLHEYQTHAGQRRGHWPSSPEITAAMFERYNSSKP